MDDDSRWARRVTDLEIRLSYQDRLLDELNEVILELRADLEAAETRIRILERRLTSAEPAEEA